MLAGDVCSDIDFSPKSAVLPRSCPLDPRRAAARGSPGRDRDLRTSTGRPIWIRWIWFYQQAPITCTHSTKPECVRQVDGPPGGVLPLELELLCPPLLDRRPPEYRVQVQRNHKQVAHVGELPLGRLGVQVQWVEIHIVTNHVDICEKLILVTKA